MNTSPVLQYPADPEMRSWRCWKVAFVGFVVAIYCFVVDVCDARTAACQDSSAPIVTLEVSTADIQELFDVSAADLKSAAASMGARTHQPALAAYSSDLTYAADISENAVQEADEVYCATVGSVHVSIALKNRVIHFARELQEKPCLQEAQLQHWREHARADAQAVEEFQFLPELRDSIGRLRPARAQSVLAAKSQVTVAVHSEIERLIDQVGKYREAAKQKVDKPESIEQLRAKMKDCPG
jgi:hypothetical protein